MAGKLLPVLPHWSGGGDGEMTTSHKSHSRDFPNLYGLYHKIRGIPRVPPNVVTSLPGLSLEVTHSIAQQFPISCPQIS